MQFKNITYYKKKNYHRSATIDKHARVSFLKIGAEISGNSVFCLLKTFVVSRGVVDGLSQ